MNTLTFLGNIKALSYKLHVVDKECFISVQFGYIEGEIGSIRIAVYSRREDTLDHELIKLWFVAEYESLGVMLNAIDVELNKAITIILKETSHDA